MPTNIGCPHCRLVLQLPDEFVGQKVRCSKCEAVFIADPRTNVTAQAATPGPSSQGIQAGPPVSTPRVGRRRRDQYFDDTDAIGRLTLGSDFKPGGGLATAVKTLLSLNIIASVLTLGGNYLQYELIDRVMMGGAVNQAELESN